MSIFARYPFILLLAGLLTGISVGSLVTSWWVAGILLFISAIIYLIISAKGGTVGGAVSMAPYHTLWVFIAVTGLGVATSISNRPYTASDDVILPFASGVVEEVSDADGGCRMYLHILSLEDASLNTKLQPRNMRAVVYADSRFYPGTYLTFVNDLHPVEPNPNIQNDYMPEYLHRKGIYFRQNIKSSEILVSYDNPGWYHRLIRQRIALSEIIGSSRLSVSARGMVAALVLGDRTLLDGNDSERFKLAGIAHILALSGMHIGFIALVFSLMLLPLSFIGIGKASRLILIILIWGYTCFTGLQPSAVRASIMMTFCLGALVLERKNASLNALMAAAFFILLADPLQLGSSGFQLSFAAAGILLISQSINPIDRHRHPHTFRIVQALVVTLTAMTGTLAIAAYHFHTLPLSAFLPNLCMACILPVFLTIALIYTGLIAAGYDSYILSWLLDKASDTINAVADFASSAPGVITGVWINGLAAAAATSAVIFFLLWISQRKRIFMWTSTTAAVFALISFLILPSGKPRDGFIVHAGVTDRVVEYNKGEIYEREPLAGNSGTWNIAGSKVAWRACPDSIQRHCDYLLVCKGGELTDVDLTTIVVGMPSVNLNERERLADECKRIGVRYHDIIRDGALRVFLDE